MYKLENISPQIPKKQKFLTLFLIKDLGSVENGHFFF